MKAFDNVIIKPCREKKPQQSSIFSPFTISFRFVIDYEHWKVQCGYRRSCKNGSKFTRHSEHRIKAALVTVACSCCLQFRFSSPFKSMKTSHVIFAILWTYLSFFSFPGFCFNIAKNTRHSRDCFISRHIHEACMHKEFKTIFSREFRALKQIGNCIHRIFRRQKHAKTMLLWA